MIVKKVLVSIFLLVFLITGCSNESTDVVNNEETTKTSTTEQLQEETSNSNESIINEIINNNDLSLTEKVELIVNDKLGSTTNTELKRLDGVEIIDDGNNDALIIVLNGNDNFTTKMIKKGMWIDSVKILEPISQIKELNEVELISIFWFLPLTNTQGNEENTIVMSFNIDIETLNQINWDNFVHNNIPNVASNYFEHSVLQE